MSIQSSNLQSSPQVNPFMRLCGTEREARVFAVTQKPNMDIAIIKSGCEFIVVNADSIHAVALRSYETKVFSGYGLDADEGGLS